MVQLREIHQVNLFGLFFSPQSLPIPFIGIMESVYCAANGEYFAAVQGYKSMTVHVIDSIQFVKQALIS